MPAQPSQAVSAGGNLPFEHQAILYAGTDDLVARATPLVEAALAAEKPVLAALTPTALGGLRESLGDLAGRVRWVDITGIGLNPARIIPVWRGFVAHHRKDGQNRPVLGIGQPVYAERTPAELVEAERHEALLNLAFAETANFELFCPYDVETLDAHVLEAAGRTHPEVRHAGVPEPSPAYRPEVPALAFTPARSTADAPSWWLPLEGRSVAEVHRFLTRRARRLAAGGAGSRRWGDLALAAVAVSAAVGGERLRIWSEHGEVLVEVEGRAPITDPLAGREWPAPTGEPAHGLWLANQLCDLMQWRSDGRGSLVRLRCR